MKFTPEQQQAVITHDCNLIVTAGAGSGKTRVLVERFLALLEAFPDWTLPSVVAITFTEKAAREMRDRVRMAIEERVRAAVAAGDDAALERWLEHRAALPRARIGTIHSLCAALLRANPAEAGIDPGFAVLDEHEAALLLDDAIERGLARLVTEDHPAAALLATYGVRAVRSVLADYAGPGTAADVLAALDGPPADLVARWQAAWPETVRALMGETRADSELSAALDFVHPDEVPPGDKLAPSWERVFAHRDALVGEDPAAWGAAVEALAGGIDLRGGSAKNWGDKDRVAEVKEALHLVRARARALRDDILPPPGDADEAAAEWLLLWRGAVGVVADEYERLKEARRALDFDDLETRARDLLRDHPAVAERYRGEFNHVLVDEFQDTNPAQRQIAERLANVGVAGADGRLFVVGDPKQSIYAFRGADVSVFGAVRDDLLAAGGQELPLSTSFRAHEALVGAFNDLFGRILTVGEGPAAAYEVALGAPLRAHRPATPDLVPEQAAPLTVLVFPRPSKDAYPEFNADDQRRWEAWTLADHLHGLVDAQVRIWDRAADHADLPAGAVVPPFAEGSGRGAYRPVQYGDMAVLFQSMTRAPLYEDVFKAAGLPYVTIAGKGYYDRQEVRDLLNLLAALHNPADDLALAVVLRSPLVGLSDDGLLALRGGVGGARNLWAALFDDAPPPGFPLDDQAARDCAVAALGELRDMAGRATIAELLTRALDLTGYPATLTGLPDGARRRGNLDKLLALARASGRVSLGAFNAYARELIAREVREGEAALDVEQAVRLMTVHASKGLEFPVVVLADASWEWRGGSAGVFTLDPDAGAACTLPDGDPAAPEEGGPFAWEYARHLAERRDRAERRRLLYVGATRAGDYLIVSGRAPGAGPHCWLSQWLAALGLDPDDLEPARDPQRLRYDWGDCTLYVPPEPPDDFLAAERGAEAATVPGWEQPDIAAGRAVPGVAAALPPLLAEVPVDPHAPARVLAPSHLEKLARAPHYPSPDQGRRAFRHAVLHDAPEPLRPLPSRVPDEHKALRRAVGEMVHRALQAWLLPGEVDAAALDARLRVYAAEADLTASEQVERALGEALRLLRAFEAGEVPARLAAAGQVYREIPFICRLGERRVEGVIDVLYFLEGGRDGGWHVLDYKTAPVTARGAYAHARQYVQQVAVYARAVQELTGAESVHAWLYYIHPGTLVYVKDTDRAAALARLEDDVRAALG